MILINTRLISHPMNWLIIAMMLIILGIFGHLVLQILDQEPSTKGSGVPQGYSTNPTG